MNDDVFRYFHWLFTGRWLSVPDAAAGLMYVLVGLGTATVCALVFIRWFLVPSAVQWSKVPEAHLPLKRTAWVWLNLCAAVSVGPLFEELMMRSWAFWIWTVHGWEAGVNAAVLSVFLQWLLHTLEPVPATMLTKPLWRPRALTLWIAFCGALYLASQIATGSLIPGIVAHLSVNVLAALWDLTFIDSKRILAYAQSLQTA